MIKIDQIVAVENQLVVTITLFYDALVIIGNEKLKNQLTKHNNTNFFISLFTVQNITMTTNYLL